MPEYIRVVEFEADDAAIDAMLKEIGSEDGPPEGVNATRITVLGDRAAGKVLVSVRFPSEGDLRKGSEVFEAMSPPDDANMRRVAVEAYEVLLERDAP
jgi:hypothetical protein